MVLAYLIGPDVTLCCIEAAHHIPQVPPKRTRRIAQLIELLALSFIWWYRNKN
jgi:hypothetical protein